MGAQFRVALADELHHVVSDADAELEQQGDWPLVSSPPNACITYGQLRCARSAFHSECYLRDRRLVVPARTGWEPTRLSSPNPNGPGRIILGRYSIASIFGFQFHVHFECSLPQSAVGLSILASMTP